MLENTPDVLTLKDLQNLLQIGKNTALKLVHSNVITAHMIAGKWLFFKKDVEEYILRN